MFAEVLVVVEDVVSQEEAAPPHLQTHILQLGLGVVLDGDLHVHAAVVMPGQVQIPVTIALQVIQVLVVQTCEPRNLDIFLITVLESNGV